MAKGQTNAGSPIIEVDSNLDLYSENPVQNKVVTEALDAKQDTLIQGSGITISNNTISVTDSDKYLKNDATANYAYAIGGTSNQNYAIGIGYSSNAIGTDGAIAIGRNSTASGSGSIAIGSGLLKRTTASGTNTVAIGDGAQANAANAIQLGSGINNNSGTLQFRSYQLVDSSGTIVDERISSNIARVADIPSAPEVDNVTISVNENNQLQAEGVLNPRTDTALRIWEGTESSWTNYQQKTYNKYGLVADSIFNDASSTLPANLYQPILGYGLGKFYLFGTDDEIGGIVAYTSTDGVDWNTGQTLPALYGFECVSEANGILYAGRNYSTDGITWNKLTSLTGTEMISNVVFANDNCYYVMKAGIMYKSTDGINFTVLQSYGSGHDSKLLYENRVFTVVVASQVGSTSDYNYKLFYGTDPAALTSIDLGTSSHNTSVYIDIYGLAYGNNKFLCTYEITTIGDNVINEKHTLSSSDGLNWVNSIVDDNGGFGLIFFYGYFLANCEYTIDGINWFRYGGLPVTIRSYAASNTRLMLCGMGSDEANYVEAGSLPQDLAGCYFEGTPVVGDTVYETPGVLSSLTVTNVENDTITLSNNVTYGQIGNIVISSTVADVHPDWLCNIENVGVKIGNDFVANMSEAEAQVQTDWNQSDSSAVDYIKNKPNLAAVAISGDYEDLSNTPNLATVATSGDYSDLTNTPTIPPAVTVDQTLNYNQNAVSGMAVLDYGFFRNVAPTKGSSYVLDSSSSLYTGVSEGATCLGVWSGPADSSGTVGQEFTSNHENITTLGYYSGAYGIGATALGRGAKALADEAIQLGQGENTTARSLQVGNYQLLDSNGKIPTARLDEMTGATSSSSGAAGIVPAPTSGDNDKFLRGDGTWAEAAVTVDNSTINKNSSNELQAIAVLNKNSSAGATNPLNLWEGTSQAWTNGEATPWYYWQTDVTALWQSGGSLPSSAYWSSVTYGDGKFVVVTSLSTKSAYSTDGINWTETTLPSSSNWSVIYGDGKFVAIGYSSDKSAYSTDGINWTASTLPSRADWASVTYGDGKFVAVVTNNSDKSAYSTDGINWTETTMPSSGNWASVTYGDGKFVAVASGDSNQAAYSTDGINWVASTLPSSAKWYSVIYGNGKFVVMTLSSNKSAYSTDGISWTASTLPSSANWRSVAYGDGKFVATADNSNKSAYSTDGINWTASTISSSANWYSVTYGDGKFVAVALNSDASAIFSISYDKCYTLDQIPTTSTQVYSAPETLSAKTITSTGEGTITLSDNLTYNYTPGGNQNTYRTIGDAHPDWLCNIEGVGVKIGNTLIAEKNSGSTVTIDSSITASSTNANAAGSKAVWDLVSALETRVAALESQL